MKLSFVFFLSLGLLIFSGCKPGEDAEDVAKPRVIVSSDIGGTDPDDFQSMIHYLMYADKFQTEGLISSPFGPGRKEHILEMIDLYEKDFPKLKAHGDFPAPDSLRLVVKQGGSEKAPPEGWSEPTEGSEWIIEKARNDASSPLWILVWGGIEDVAQALHDAPDIADKIRVYWIGGPNKKWSRNAYHYIAQNFPDLWMIENNATYRGWFLDENAAPGYGNTEYFNNVIQGKGAMGTDFVKYYDGSIKMGDTPSVAYLMNGDPDDPAGESWGGSFEQLPYSALRVFDRHTSPADTIPTYSMIVWNLQTDPGNLPDGDQEIWMEIDGQRINGFYKGDGVFTVRFVPKRIGNWMYTVNCSAEELDGLTGEFTSANPWPGKPHENNIPLNNWWSDRTDPDLYIGEYQGAQTVARWRTEYLSDWAERLEWLDE